MAEPIKKMDINKQDPTWDDGIINALQTTVDSAASGIFEVVQASLQNGITYTVIMVSAMVWLLLRLKNGYPTKDEMYSAGKWLMLVLFVYAVFYSYDSYKGFISLFMLPSNWVQSAIINGMDIEIPKSSAGSSSNFLSVIGDYISLLHNLSEQVIQFKLDEMNGWMAKVFGIRIIPDFLGKMLAYIETFSLTIFFTPLFFIFLLGVTIMITISQFTASLLLTAAPIMIPLIVFKNLRVYFYSWLKLFISYSLYAPIALIIFSIATKPLTVLKQYDKSEGLIKNIANNPNTYVFSLVIITIICTYLLTKIPNWVSQIMGVQGLDSAGAGAGHAIQKFATKAPIMAAGGVATGGLGGAASAMGAGKGLGGIAGSFAKGGLGGAARGFSSGIIGEKTTRAVYQTWRKARATRDSVKDAQAKA